VGEGKGRRRKGERRGRVNKSVRVWSGWSGEEENEWRQMRRRREGRGKREWRMEGRRREGRGREGENR